MKLERLDAPMRLAVRVIKLSLHKYDKRPRVAHTPEADDGSGQSHVSDP